MQLEARQCDTAARLHATATVVAAAAAAETAAAAVTAEPSAPARAAIAPATASPKVVRREHTAIPKLAAGPTTALGLVLMMFVLIFVLVSVLPLLCAHCICNSRAESIGKPRAQQRADARIPRHVVRNLGNTVHAS